MTQLPLRLLFALCAASTLAVACDDAAVAGDEVAAADDAAFGEGDDVDFRTCPVPPCPGGTDGNTSYAGEWALANFNTVPGVHATNWDQDGDTHTVALINAVIAHAGKLRSATVGVTSDGELRAVYKCDVVQECDYMLLTGAQVVGLRMNFGFYVANVLQAQYYVRIQDYASDVIHGKTRHIYTPFSNAPKGTEIRDYALCNSNAEGNSEKAVFIPGMELHPNQLEIAGRTNGAIIACETGADGKLVLKYDYHQSDFGIARRWTAGLKMTTGDICGTGESFTTPGRLIDIEDSLGLRDWSSFTAREGDYDHTGMVCRGDYFRGPLGQDLDLVGADCLDSIPFCGSTLTTPAAGAVTFGVKVQGPPI